MIDSFNEPRSEGPLQNRAETKVNHSNPDGEVDPSAYLDNDDPASIQGVLDQLLELGEMEYKYQPIPLYDVIGRPRFRPEAELTDAEVQPSLAKLLRVMGRYGIQLDVLAPDDYDARTLYRFVTQELFPYETFAIGDDWVTRFVYEEFHPNHRYSIAKLSDAFLRELLNGDFFDLGTILTERYVYRQIEPYQIHVLPEVTDHLVELLESWWPQLPIGGFTAQIQIAEDGEQAQAELVVQLAKHGSTDVTEQKGTIYLSRADLWWFIERIEFGNWVLA